MEAKHHLHSTRVLEPSNAGALAALEHTRCGLDLVVDDRAARIAVLDSSSISPKATAHSPLFTLPFKVRNTIYRYALTLPHPVSIKKHSTTETRLDSPERASHLLLTQWRYFPGLLNTCRAIREEAASVFYARNAFTCTLRSGDLSEVRDWLRDTDASCLRLVARVVLVVEPTSFADLQALTLSASRSGGESGLEAQCSQLVGAMEAVGMSRSVFEVGLPVLRHLMKDAILMQFDGDDAEGIRGRWVEEFWKFAKGAELSERIEAAMKLERLGNVGGEGKEMEEEVER